MTRADTAADHVTLPSTGVTVRYRWDGPPEAPVLVLANSLGTSMDLWGPQLAALRGRFRVLRYEHRGHGGAPAPPGPYTIGDLGADLVGLLDVLDVPSASICGLSLGGMVAMWVASHAPQKVERLVLSCTAPALPPAQVWHDRAARARTGGTGSLLDSLAERWFTPDFLAGHPDVFDLVAAMLTSAEAEGYAGCCEAIAAMDLTADLARIAAPTLVIGGRIDPVTPPAMLADMAQRITGAGLVVLAGASHLANLQQPHRFTEAVVDHLVGPPAERGDRVRRAVLGDIHVERARQRSTAFDEPFQELITRSAWGEVWTRPGLDRTTRSCLTLAMLVALGRMEELPMHLRGALRSGLSRAQIAEVLLQTAVYCGAPAANSAFAVAQRTFDEIDTAEAGAAPR